MQNHCFRPLQTSVSPGTHSKGLCVLTGGPKSTCGDEDSVEARSFRATPCPIVILSMIHPLFLSCFLTLHFDALLSQEFHVSLPHFTFQVDFHDSSPLI